MLYNTTPALKFIVSLQFKLETTLEKKLYLTNRF